jgi:hypothetical protein
MLPPLHQSIKVSGMPRPVPGFENAGVTGLGIVFTSAVNSGSVKDTPVFGAIPFVGLI